MCDIIIDSGSYENIVSTALVKAFELPIEKHPRAYKVRWIKRGLETRVTKTCHVPFSIGKYYQDEILCDVVDMDACHVLLGRPWKYDVNALHKGKENNYVFPWCEKKIVLLLLLPKPYSTPMPTLLAVSGHFFYYTLGNQPTRRIR